MTIYVIAIEPIESRYSGHWCEFVPGQIEKHTGKNVTQIMGRPISTKPTEGAFLDFAATNIWKGDQAIAIAHLFQEGKVKSGDYFLYLDAWNPTIIQTRYMADLFNIDIKFGGLWHAGAYDQHDFLGKKIKHKRWAFSFEKSIYQCIDHNFFATEFSQFLMEQTINVRGRGHVVGWPMEYYHTTGLEDFDYSKKEDLIVFPHRISSEKQPELFRKLATILPEYKFVVCQDEVLTKDEYHEILKRAKIVFSANLQETLGIGVYEGMLAGAIPVVPARLSYVEQYHEAFTYPEDTENRILKLATQIVTIMKNYSFYNEHRKVNVEQIKQKFFNGEAMYRIINE